MIPAEKQEKFTILKRFAVNMQSQALSDLVDYLEVLHAPVPLFHTNFTYVQHVIYGLFRSPKYWDIFEERLLIFCREVLWLETNYSNKNTEEYRNAFLREIILKPNMNLSIEGETLLKHGFSESQIWFLFHNYDYYYIKSHPLVFQYIVNYAEKYVSIMPYNFCYSRSFIQNIIANKPDLLDKYLDKFMRGISHGNEVIVLNDFVQKYLNRKPKKHETYLVSLLSETNNAYHSMFSLIDLIKTNYPNKYQNEIDVCAKRHIQLIINDSDETYSSVFEQFLDLLLVYNSPEIAFKISANYLNKFKNPNAESVKIWLKKLKLYNLST